MSEGKKPEPRVAKYPFLVVEAKNEKRVDLGECPAAPGNGNSSSFHRPCSVAGVSDQNYRQTRYRETNGPNQNCKFLNAQEATFR